MLCAIIGDHPTAFMTQQATKNETSAKTLASLFQMKKNEENMSILGRECVPVGNANKYNLNSHSFAFAGTAMFPSSSKGGIGKSCWYACANWRDETSINPQISLALSGQLIICNSKLLSNLYFLQFIVWYAHHCCKRGNEWNINEKSFFKHDVFFGVWTNLVKFSRIAWRILLWVQFSLHFQ